MAAIGRFRSRLSLWLEFELALAAHSLQVQCNQAKVEASIKQAKEQIVLCSLAAAITHGQRVGPD